MTQVAVLSNDSRLEEALRAAGLRAGRLGAAGLAEFERAAQAPAAVVVDVRDGSGVFKITTDIGIT